MADTLTEPRAADAPAAPGRVRARLSMRGYLWVMVVAILLPAILFATILFWRYYDSEIAALDQQLRNNARQLALDVDRDLQSKIVALQALATAGSIDSQNYERFYQRALKIKELAGVDISLRSRDGQQLANTRVPWGTPLPRNLFPSDQEVIANKRIYISNLVEGLVAGHPIYLISAPVIENGAVTYILHMTVDPSRVEELLKANISEGELAGVLDRDNVVVARTEGSRERLGKRASQDFIDNIGGPEGTWLGRNVQGYKIRLGYARSKLSGWLVWVGVADAQIQAGLRSTLWELSAIGAVLTVVAIGLASLLGRRLAGAAAAVAAQAAALGRGDVVAAAPIPVRELDAVGRELVAASARRNELERQLVQAATRESEQRFQMLVEGVTDYAIYMLDADGKVTYWNSGAMRIKGYSADEIIGQHFSRFYTPEDRTAGLPDRALATARREGRYEAEGWRVRKDGSRFFASVVIDRISGPDGKLVGFAKITRDITERREAQQRLEAAREQLYQSQKMEAVGQLTGGVAHDFNNLLTIIIGNLDTAKRTLENWKEGAEARLARAIDHALVGAQRAATLTGHLLAFSRRQPLEPKRLDVNRLLNQLSAFLKPVLGEQIQLEVVGGGGLWPVEVDAVQLETALLNLAVNARDAMPNGGKLTIEAGNVLLDEHYCANNAEVRPGQYVQIAVTDSGSGMAREIADRAFEPFFTTKEVGHGTGLGLSQVYGFVKQSGGHVKIYSEPGQGTTVKVYLPRLHGDAGEPEAPGAAATPSAYGRETILVVEDDEDVRAFICETLEELNYSVLQAASAAAALRILDAAGAVDLLLTDVILPGPNGREVATAAQAKRPGLKVVFMTGYSRNAIVHQGRLDEGVQLIQKPLTQAALAAKIRDVLDGRAGA